MDKTYKLRARWAAVGLAAIVFAILFTLSARAAEFIPLGSLPGDRFNSRALGVSDDGRVVVGEGHVFPGERPLGFVWTRETGMQDINDVIGGEPIFERVVDVSGDGSTFVGQYHSPDADGAFRWSEAGGLLRIENGREDGPFHIPAAVSNDGSAFVGYVSEDIFSTQQAFRYSDAGGLELLGYLPGGGVESQALGISADGSVVVGFSDSENSEREAFRWTLEEGMIGLGGIPGNDVVSLAFAISGGGGTVVGQAGVEGIGVAFLWTEELGMQLIPELPGSISPSIAWDVSRNGSTIIGGTRNDGAFIWTEESGSRFFEDVIRNEYDLADSLSGWTRLSPNAISANGQHIVGVGTNPDGDSEAWLVTVPEPASAASGMAGLIFVLLHIRRMRR